MMLTPQHRRFLSLILASSALSACSSVNILSQIDGPYVPRDQEHGATSQPASAPTETVDDLAEQPAKAVIVARADDLADEASPPIEEPSASEQTETTQAELIAAEPSVGAVTRPEIIGPVLPPEEMEALTTPSEELVVVEATPQTVPESEPDTQAEPDAFAIFAQEDREDFTPDRFAQLDPEVVAALEPTPAKEVPVQDEAAIDNVEDPIDLADLGTLEELNNLPEVAQQPTEPLEEPEPVSANVEAEPMAEPEVTAAPEETTELVSQDLEEPASLIGPDFLPVEFAEPEEEGAPPTVAAEPSPAEILAEAPEAEEAPTLIGPVVTEEEPVELATDLASAFDFVAPEEDADDQPLATQETEFDLATLEAEEPVAEETVELAMLEVPQAAPPQPAPLAAPALMPEPEPMLEAEIEPQLELAPEPEIAAALEPAPELPALSTPEEVEQEFANQQALQTEAAQLGFSVANVMPDPGNSATVVAAQSGTDAYRAFYDWAMDKLENVPPGGGRESMLLLDPPSLDPALQLCGNLPPAVLIDLDPANGLLPLVGADNPNPALSGYLAVLRARGVTVYWISGHGPNAASAIRQRLARSALDPAGVDPLIVTRFAGESKQERRYALGDSNCLLAILGDHRADFDELYDFVLDPVMAAPLEGLVENGWFIAPSPIN